MPIDWTPLLKKRNLNEDEMLRHTYGGYNNQGYANIGRPDVNTQIRNYVPDPNVTGDFGMVTDPNMLRYLYYLKNKTTDL